MKKLIVPIAFAFDNNLTFPACVCLSSLMMSANKDTFYDIFILHSSSELLDTRSLSVVSDAFENCRIQYRQVENVFDYAFEIRGITTPAYYRLLIPELITEYDKVIYSDVDVIFRDDLSDIYFHTDLSDEYFAGVNSLSHLLKDTKDYYENSLDEDLAKIMRTMTRKAERLNLGTSFYDEYSHENSPQSHLINNTDLKLTEKTVNDALASFTEETDIPVVIVVEDMEDVFGKTMPMGDIIVLVVLAGLAVAAIVVIVRTVKNRKKFGGGNPEDDDRNNKW